MRTTSKTPSPQSVIRMRRVENIANNRQQLAAMAFVDSHLTPCRQLIPRLFTGPADQKWLEAWHTMGDRYRRVKCPKDGLIYECKGLSPYGLVTVLAHALGYLNRELSALTAQ